jgi:4'-phosphopantetheinyl transferase
MEASSTLSGAARMKRRGSESVDSSPIHGPDETDPWCAPPCDLALQDEEVHVWQSGLKPGPEAVERFAERLSPDEQVRADRFHFDKDRHAYIAARGILRTLLGTYLDAPPESLVFSYGSRGKPALGADFSNGGIRFNVSHSGKLALYAFALDREIGVDIERIRPDFGGVKIARRFFSTSEVSALLALPAEKQTRAFFDCWTRKEAFIKALGEGLYFPLDAFDVAFEPGKPAELLATRPDAREAERWSIRGISVPPEYAAAVAVESRAFDLRRFLWPATRQADEPLSPLVESTGKRRRDGIDALSGHDLMCGPRLTITCGDAQV